MRAPRIYVDASLVVGDQLTLPAGGSQHLIQVLRLRVGDAIVLFNGDGRDFSAHLLTTSRSGVLVQVGAGGEPEAPPALRVHLGIGVSKGERMDYTLQKSVELGVTRITPLFTRRSVVRLSGVRLEKRMKHWQGIVHAACEQSGRRRLPEFAKAGELGTWLGHPHATPLLLDHRSQTSLPDLRPPDGELTLLVGPEGGLAESERALALDAGFKGVRLGPRILRTETAPLAALAAAQVLWGDYRGNA